MPNIKILNKFTDSVLLDAIQASNKMKTEREAHKGVHPQRSEASPRGRGCLKPRWVRLPDRTALSDIPSCCNHRRSPTRTRAVSHLAGRTPNLALQGKRVAMVSFSPILPIRARDAPPKPC